MSPPRRAVAAALLLAAAGCPGTSGDGTTETPDDAPPVNTKCSPEALASFDPGSPVRERRMLPPMEQKLGEQTVYLANVPCEKDESDEACTQRARREVAAQYPPPAKLTAKLVRELHAWRARLTVDGEERQDTFLSADRLREELDRLRAEGHSVELLGAEPIATQDAPRSVDVGATAPATETKQVALRYRLTLEPPVNDVATMLRLQRRAAAAALAIQFFSMDPDGSLVVELTCRTTREEPTD